MAVVVEDTEDLEKANYSGQWARNPRLCIWVASVGDIPLLLWL